VYLSQFNPSYFLSRGDARISHIHSHSHRERRQADNAPFWYHSLALYFPHGSYPHSSSQSTLTLTINASLPLGQCCNRGLVCLCLFSCAFAFFVFVLSLSLSHTHTRAHTYSLSLSRQEDEKGKPCCVVSRPFLSILVLCSCSTRTRKQTHTHQGGNGWSPTAPSE
jgi:hypothetical protein